MQQYATVACHSELNSQLSKGHCCCAYLPVDTYVQLTTAIMCNGSMVHNLHMKVSKYEKQDIIEVGSKNILYPWYNTATCDYTSSVFTSRECHKNNTIMWNKFCVCENFHSPI